MITIQLLNKALGTGVSVPVSVGLTSYIGARGPAGADGPQGIPGPDAAVATHAAASKATPVDADELPLVDSAATWGLKRLTWANLKATLKSYFDTLYASPSTGIFTPAVAFGGGSTGITYTTRTGTYTKIGNRVDFKLYVKLSNKGSAVGNVSITGLPFASNSAANTFAAMQACLFSLVGVASVQSLIWPSSNEVVLYSGVTTTRLTDANFANNSEAVISGTYFV